MSEQGVEGILAASGSQARVERERALAMEAVLTNAAELGVETAVQRFGGALTQTERQLLITLTPDELTAFNATRQKLGGLAQLRARDDNNNNNL
ncbi:hypothetical protein GCM10010368_48700 [Streptomyces roseiscleroticus]|uniref:Uncharacterized protein n=1 Tax=Streptomyces roseiscleroticus TaxID=1972 RepID=A0ABP5RSK4_9ACTN